MPKPRITTEELTGRVPLLHRSRERFCHLIAAETSRIEAYLTVCEQTISRPNASRGAGEWLKRPEIRARVEHLTCELARKQGQTVAPDAEASAAQPMPDISTLAGRQEVLAYMIRRFYDGAIKDSDAIAAIKELIKINRDIERISDKASQVDPAQIMVALSRIQGEGVTVADIAEDAGFSMAELASRICAACGLDAVTVRRGQSIGTHGTLAHAAQTKHDAQGHTAAHSTAPQPAAAVHGDTQASTQGEPEGAPPPPCANGGDTSGPKTSLPRNGICPTVESAEVPDSDWSDPAVAPVAQVKRARKPKAAEGSLAEFLKIR